MLIATHQSLVHWTKVSINPFASNSSYLKDSNNKTIIVFIQMVVMPLPMQVNHLVLSLNLVYYFNKGVDLHIFVSTYQT